MQAIFLPARYLFRHLMPVPTRVEPLNACKCMGLARLFHHHVSCMDGRRVWAPEALRRLAPYLPTLPTAIPHFATLVLLVDPGCGDYRRLLASLSKPAIEQEASERPDLQSHFFPTPQTCAGCGFCIVPVPVGWGDIRELVCSAHLYHQHGTSQRHPPRVQIPVWLSRPSAVRRVGFLLLRRHSRLTSLQARGSSVPTRRQRKPPSFLPCCKQRFSSRGALSRRNGSWPGVLARLCCGPLVGNGL
ncbi:hypothetical protein B0T25DRAFT_18422 [Lasiosphaeria hispida]|uniref:Uncharacterized protein n=1 Tax=Lasiosphaeria hispida TaxID=260671 RepID=A0AAJ0HU85_9PEZI|nr:hypothetical protein B0T25DRAFT_18422 [Lasiosphaeria hispida]